MSAHKGTLTELGAAFHKLPEFVFIFAGAAGYIHEIEGYNTLIESAIVFVCTIFTETGNIRCKEAAASHAGVNITVFVFFHFLCGNVIRYHALCSALGSKLCEIPVPGSFLYIVLIQHIDKLGECRGNIYTLFVFYTEYALLEHFFYDHCKVIPKLTLGNLVKIHEYSNERCLSVSGHKSDHLVLDHLYASLNLRFNTHLSNFVYLFVACVYAGLLKFLAYFLAEFLAADVNKRYKVGERDALSAVL